MKRVGNLFDTLCSFENLHRASRKARRGKRSLREVEQFEFNLESHLVELSESLRDRTYRPGPFRSFTITDPKPRLISAAPYPDRLVHHPRKRAISRVEDGIRFLGYRVWPDHGLLAQSNVLRFRRRLRRMQHDVRNGRLSQSDVTRRIRSWIGHACQADTRRLRTRLLGGTFFRGAAARVSCSPGRFVQQQPAKPAVGQSQQEHTRQP